MYSPDDGDCAAKDWHYWGLKGGLRMSSTGMIVAAPRLPASPHDRDLLDSLLLDVPAGTTILGDKGVIDRDTHTALNDRWGILLKTPLKRNMRDRPGFRLAREGNRRRRVIETVIGQLTEQFHVQSLRVRKGWTLASKWYRKILAQTIGVFTNLKYGYPPTQLETLICD